MIDKKAQLWVRQDLKTKPFVFDSYVVFEPKHEDYEQQPYVVNQKDSCVDRCNEPGRLVTD